MMMIVITSLAWPNDCKIESTSNLRWISLCERRCLPFSPLLSPQTRISSCQKFSGRIFSTSPTSAVDGCFSSKCASRSTFHLIAGWPRLADFFSGAWPAFKRRHWAAAMERAQLQIRMIPSVLRYTRCCNRNPYLTWKSKANKWTGQGRPVPVFLNLAKRGGNLYSWKPRIYFFSFPEKNQTYKHLRLPPEQGVFDDVGPFLIVCNLFNELPTQSFAWTPSSTPYIVSTVRQLPDMETASSNTKSSEVRFR